MNEQLIELFNTTYKDYLEGICYKEYLTNMLKKFTVIIKHNKSNINLYIKKERKFILVCSLNENDKYKNIIQLPILFNNRINGMITLDTCDNNLFENTKEFRNMLGVLFNNLHIKQNNQNIKEKTKNFIAFVSHELRNPLQVINTGLYIMTKTINDNEDNNQYDSPTISSKSLSDSELNTNQYNSPTISPKSLSDSELNTNETILKRVNSACNNMNVIINDILDLTKIENNEMFLNIECYNLREIIECINEEFIIIANKKGLDFEFIINDNCPNFIKTDNTRLYQILSNLINNSIKYSRTGKIILDISVKNNMLIFNVIDNGRGIKEEELNKLFKIFGRTIESMEDINSSGLGLCISNKIAEILGGKIEVKSEYKKGSIFSLYHPININNICKINIKDKKEIKNICGSILIIDNDKNITSLFKLLLKFLSHEYDYDLEINTTNTYEKSLEIINRKNYNLIFIDIDLENSEGYYISKIIKEKYKNSKIIAIIANIKIIQNNNEKYKIFNDILLKPFSNNDINNIITKYM